MLSMRDCAPEGRRFQRQIERIQQATSSKLLPRRNWADNLQPNCYSRRLVFCRHSGRIKRCAPRWQSTNRRCKEEVKSIRGLTAAALQTIDTRTEDGRPATNFCGSCLKVGLTPVLRGPRYITGLLIVVHGIEDNAADQLRRNSAVESSISPVIARTCRTVLLLQLPVCNAVWCWWTTTGI